MAFRSYVNLLDGALLPAVLSSTPVSLGATVISSSIFNYLQSKYDCSRAAKTAATTLCDSWLSCLFPMPFLNCMDT